MTSSLDPSMLENYPAGRPPAGVTPNFIDPPSRATDIKILDGVFTGCMLLAVIIRYHVRLRYTKQWGWDDFACAMAVLGSLAHLIMYTQTIKLVGFGRHMWDIRASWLMDKQNNQLLSVNGIIYPFTIFFTKLSILLLYNRIFKIDRKFVIQVWGGIIIMALFYAAMMGVGIGSTLRCHGPDVLKKQFCKNYSGPIIVLNATFNVVTDFWILLLPSPFLLKLQLPLRRKIGLAVTFAAGLAACAASLARMIENAINYNNDDTLGVQAINAEFTIVEINVGIIVACVTSFPTFYNHTKVYLQSTTTSLRTLLGSSSRSSTHSDPKTSLENTQRS